MGTQSNQRKSHGGSAKIAGKHRNSSKSDGFAEEQQWFPMSPVYIVPFHNSSPYQSIEPSYFAGEFVKSTSFAGDLFIFSHGLTCFDPDLSFTGCPRQLQDIFQRPLPG